MPELVLYGIRLLAPAIPRNIPRHGGGPVWEKVKLEDLKTLTEYKYPVHWYPIQWAQSVLRRCYSQGNISSDLLYDKLNQELLNISSRNGTLLSYAWVNIPLVYTQVRYML